MAAKNTLPRFEPDAATTALYLALAENKAAADRAKRSITELDRQVLAALGDRETFVDLPGELRLTTTRTPSKITRRAATTARATVAKRRPDLYPDLVTEVTPSRRSQARITVPTWAHVTARYDGVLTLDAPVTRRTIPAAAALLRQAREFLSDTRREDATMRDELDARLADGGLLESHGQFVHRCPGGGEYVVRPTAVTHRLDTRALQDADPELYLAVTREVVYDPKWEVSIAPVLESASAEELQAE